MIIAFNDLHEIALTNKKLVRISLFIMPHCKNRCI